MYPKFIICVITVWSFGGCQRQGVSTSAQTAPNKPVQSTSNPSELLVQSQREIAIFPEEPAPFYNRGFAYRLLGDTSKAISNFDRSLQLGGESFLIALAYRQRGIAYAQQGELKSALRDLNKSVEVDDGISASYLCRAEILRAMGPADLAKDDYESVLNLGAPPELLLIAWMAYINILDEQGNASQTRRELAQLIDLFPNYFPAHFKQARELWSMGCYRRALNKFNIAWQLTLKCRFDSASIDSSNEAYIHNDFFTLSCEFRRLITGLCRFAHDILKAPRSFLMQFLNEDCNQMEFTRQLTSWVRRLAVQRLSG